ncbi:MAG: prepilin-type N-terminal cleavage/methylation domain-containing protein [Candidatus Roizmanbacteria bacterium]
MVPYRSSSHAGFTLIELLVATGIIAVLMTVVIVAVNPFRMFAAAQQTKRSSDVSTLGKSLDTYLVSMKGVVPTQMYPLNTPKPIAKNSGGPEADLCGLLSTHIAGLPIDPNSPGSIVKDCGSTYSTGYSVVANSSGKIGVYSPTGISLVNQSGVNVAVYGQVADEFITPPSTIMAFAAGTFTPALAKRTPPAGPFAAGVMVQGKADGTGTGDSLTATTGTLINGNFYPNFDTNQGSIVLWITPEWNGNDGIRHEILNNNQFYLFKGTNNRLGVSVNDGTWRSYDVDVSGWTAGTTYNVVFRWATGGTLDGTNHFSISINGSHNFGMTILNGFTSTSFFYIGSQSNQTFANALIQGLTIYRRPLYEATTPSGINVGNGDELTQIYNGGTGRDPTLVTGSWDVVFALPTNSTVGALGTTGEAWSHPHASNLLYTNTTNTGGYMMNGTYTSDGWSAQNAGGSPVTVAALATGSKIFSGGYSVASAGTANQGISYTTASLASGANYVLRAIGNSDGTCNPMIKVFRADGTTLVTSLAGTTTSTRTAPTVYIFTWQTPAAETEQIHLLNTATTGTCSWHQVEVLGNLENAPSFETGSGNPWLPTAWENWGVPVGGSSQETTIVHSGASSLKYNGGYAGAINENSGGSLGDFIGYGVFAYGTANTLCQHVSDYYLQNLSGTGIYGNTAGNRAWNTTNNQWELVKSVRNKRNTDWQRYFLDRSNSSVTGYFDDIYAFLLTPITLTLTPASLANSTEASGVRVDGYDSLTQNVNNLTRTVGEISFNYTPRHSAAQAYSFKQNSNGAYVATLYNNTNDRVHLYWSAANILTLSAVMNGTLVTGTWDATGAIAAGTTYTMKLAYVGASTMTLSVNSVVNITLSSIPAGFGTVPTTVYWGSLYDGSAQGDATFAAAP